MSTELYDAVNKNDLKLVNSLINDGANIKTNKLYGFTLLHLACLEGHTDMAKLLVEVEKDVNVNAISSNGLTSLHIACLKGSSDIVKLLLAKKADVNNSEFSGSTPLFLACDGGYYDIVKLLIEKGAEVNITNNDGETPLFLACSAKHTNTSKLLILHTLFRNPAIEKPTYIQDNKQLSHFWDVQLKKINYLLKSKNLGCENAIAVILDKSSREGNTLPYLALSQLFKLPEKTQSDNSKSEKLSITPAH